MSVHLRVAYVSDGDENLEGILVVWFTDASLNVSFNLGLALFPMAK